MKLNKINELIISLPVNLSSIIKKIDINGLGIIFIVDKSNRLIFEIFFSSRSKDGNLKFLKLIFLLCVSFV